ncbi:hypothetical protein GW17_00045565 [Ensete ventricosum]|nr:hypothetical protein GW17_00045565 [Ensete ventricosum]
MNTTPIPKHIRNIATNRNNSAVVRLTGTEEGGQIARPGSTDGWVRDSTSSEEEEEEKVEEREVQIGRRSRFARWVLSGWDIPNPVPSLGLALPDRGPTPETTKGREPRVSIKTGSTYDVIHDIDGDVWVPCHYDDDKP